MRILVLGASGFIGRNMADYFAAYGHDVVRHGFKRAQYSYPGEPWIKHDLREPFDFTGYDVVIHAAATTSGSRDIVNTPALHVTDNAVMGSYIFRACAEAKVKHVIFFSCSTMFSKGHVTEESPIEIHPKYHGIASTKLYLEQMCKFFSNVGTTKFTAIRHSNIFGKFDKFDLERSHFFGATVAKVEHAVDKITIWGDGQEARDLLYIDDLVHFVELVIEKQHERFALLNCGSGCAIKVYDVVKKIIDASGKNLLVECDITKPTIAVSLSLDCTKAKQYLGWEPRTSLEEGTRLTLDWYRKNKL